MVTSTTSKISLAAVPRAPHCSGSLDRWRKADRSGANAPDRSAFLAIGGRCRHCIREQQNIALALMVSSCLQFGKGRSGGSVRPIQSVSVNSSTRSSASLRSLSPGSNPTAPRFTYLQQNRRSDRACMSRSHAPTQNRRGPFSNHTARKRAMPEEERQLQPVIQ
jgi:hypothetical protein